MQPTISIECHLAPNVYVSTQNVPRLWKGISQGNIRTTLDYISDLIQSERDLSLFTSFSYSKYSIKDGQKVIFLIRMTLFLIKFDGTIMEETIGRWSKKSSLKVGCIR